WLIGPDGKIFELTLEYGSPAWTRIFSVIKEDIEKAGIKLNLKQLDWRTLYQKVQERKFKIAWQSWGAILFPNPESSWRSKLADELHNNNVPGFKSRKVDKLCDKYNVTLDRKEQIKIIRQIDGIIFKKFPYALGWYASHSRILFWNRLGHPKAFFSRVGDARNILSMWWYEPDKERELIKAQQDGTKLPVGETIHRPWEKYGKMEEEKLK
ncbi:MAG: ABC transporter substrate-binding protein, partial [Planctomycetota bacterium]